MAHNKTIHPREWDERMAPAAWVAFASGALAAGLPAADAAKRADALVSQAQQRFVREDIDGDRD